MERRRPRARPVSACTAEGRPRRTSEATAPFTLADPRRGPPSDLSAFPAAPRSQHGTLPPPRPPRLRPHGRATSHPARPGRRSALPPFTLTSPRRGPLSDLSAFPAARRSRHGTLPPPRPPRLRLHGRGTSRRTSGAAAPPAPCPLTDPRRGPPSDLSAFPAATRSLHGTLPPPRPPRLRLRGRGASRPDRTGRRASPSPRSPWQTRAEARHLTSLHSRRRHVRGMERCRPRARPVFACTTEGRSRRTSDAAAPPAPRSP